MKYFSIIFITLWIFLSSCTKVFFEEPQPAGKKNLSSIPGKVQDYIFLIQVIVYYAFIKTILLHIWIAEDS